jgi:hypothetical protein
VAAQAQGDLRGLKILVAVMGVLIVFGTALVIGVVLHRMMAPHLAAVVAAPVAAGAALGAGEHVGAIAAAGPDLAIWVSGPAGDRVLLLDPVTGRLTQALGPAR